jgi:hypothetical protein
MSQIEILQTNFEVSCKLLFHSKPAWIQKFLLKKRISDREGRQISQKTLKSNPSCSADRSIKFAINIRERQQGTIIAKGQRLDL